MRKPRCRRVSVRIAGVHWVGQELVRMEPVSEFEAVLRPTAVPSVVSTSVAETAGITLMDALPSEAKYVLWARRKAEMGLALVRVGESPARLCILGVSDAITRRAGAEVILGSDVTEPIRIPGFRVASGTWPESESVKVSASIRRRFAAARDVVTGEGGSRCRRS